MTSAISGVAGGMSPQVMSGASMRQPPAQRMGNLFNKIDSSGSGTITKAQFEQAFQSMNPPQGLKSMGADAIFSQLDPNNTGSVDKQQFVSGMKQVLSQMRSQGAAQHGSASGTSGGNQATGRDPMSELATALRGLESTLGGQTSSAQNVVTGTLFASKA